jgi:hypothetical protein
MASSDIFTISALLVLIMGAVCFYLYTRIKQVEKKVTLVEGILLDLKTATEASFMDFPAASSYMFAKDIGQDDESEEDDEDQNELEASDEAPFEPEDELRDESGLAETVYITKIVEEEPQEAPAEVAAPVDDEFKSVQVSKPDTITNNLEMLNVKELSAIARSKGIAVSKSMKKQQLIELIGAKGSESAEVAAEPMEDSFAADSDLLGGNSSLASAPY